MDRLINLGVATEGSEDYFRTFQDISELARNLGESHSYVSVSASVVGEEDDVEDVSSEAERLHHDENTLRKVYDAIMKNGLSRKTAEDVVNNLQNAGILFRERRPLSEEEADRGVTVDNEPTRLF